MSRKGLRALMLSAALPCALLSAAGPAIADVGTGVLTKACAPTEHYQDGTVGPVVCADGKPNPAVTRQLEGNTPRIMKLSAAARRSAIASALCADLRRATNPMVLDAYTYQYARYHWRHVNPSPRALGDLLVAGKLCP